MHSSYSSSNGSSRNNSDTYSIHTCYADQQQAANSVDIVVYGFCGFGLGVWAIIHYKCCKCSLACVCVHIKHAVRPFI